MRIFILTLNWNGSDKICKLYDSLYPSLRDIEYQWLIKDNNSKDDSILKIKSWDNKKVKLLEYPHNNDSFSYGCNLLFNHSDSPNDDDLILLLNNDVIFNDNNSLKNMINIIKKDDSVGAVGARLKYSNSNKLQHAGVIFSKLNQLPYHFKANQVVDSESEKNREFQAVTGAVLLTKVKYFKQISDSNKSKLPGLDEDLIWAFDDISSCLSIKYNLNKKIIYCGSTDIFHEESASLKKNPVNKLYMHQNVNLFKNKWKSKYIVDEDFYKNTKFNLYNV